MKKLFMGILLPLFAFVSLVGAGFSTWYFQDQLSADGNKNISLKVENYAQIGEFTLTDGVVMSLDQKTDLGYGTGAGVTLNKALNISYKHDQDYTVPSSDTFVLTITVTIDENLAKYIKMADTLDDVTKKSGTADNVYEFDFSAKLTSGDLSVDIPTNAFDYVEKAGEKLGEPTTKAEYDTMVTNVTGKFITVTANASIKKTA